MSFKKFLGNVFAGQGASVTINGQTWGGGDSVQGEGSVSAQDRKLEGFDRIDTSVMCELRVIVGAQGSVVPPTEPTGEDPYRVEAPTPERPYGVVVTAQANLQPIVKTEVRKSTLHLWSEGSFSTSKPIQITVHLPALVGLSSSGHGLVDVEGLQGERFELAHSGMGNLSLQGSTAHFAADISGHGTVNIRDLYNHAAVINHSGMGSLNVVGSTASLVATLSGHGTIDLRQFPSPWVHLMASGMGNIRVHATQAAKGYVSGHGTVFVYGHPSDWNVRHDGMGSVKFM